MKYTDTLSKLGLAKNEAKIYETLLTYGEMPVGQISNKAEINRRNVYDSLKRLIEKGLLFEILQKGENLYQAVDPRKLLESLKEKEVELEGVMPELEKLYGKTPREDSVYVYRGIEGAKNYMRDILRLGGDLYSIGGKGYWSDPRFEGFFERAVREGRDKGIVYHELFDSNVKHNKEILKILKVGSRILPKGYETNCAIDIFGDRVVILSGVAPGDIGDNPTMTVIVNQDIANTFRTWWKLLAMQSKKFD